ncbi:MAG: hypothetical protein ABJB66_18935 [Gemmatimonadaceae bacterium]
MMSHSSSIDSPPKWIIAIAAPSSLLSNLDISRQIEDRILDHLGNNRDPEGSYSVTIL